MTTTYTRKIGRNRGKPRLWIEGALLVSAGFKPGDRYHLHFGTMATSIGWCPDGARKVSGKGEKPIIDIAGSGLGPLQEAETVTIEIVATRTLIITPNFKQEN